MTNELDELSEINPVQPDHLIGAVAIDRETLFDTFEADEQRPRSVRRLRSVSTGSAARVGYVGAGLLVAAGFAAIAVVGIGDLSEDEAVVDPAVVPEPDPDQDGVPVVEVPQPDVDETPGEPPIAAVGEAATALDAGEGTDGAATDDESDQTEAEPVDEAATADGTGEGQTNDAAPCQASGATMSEAAAAYEAACSEPRADCDAVDGVWVCSSEVLGQSAPGLRGGDPAADSDPDAVRRPTIDGPFDPDSDVLSLHYDQAPSRDDALASVAAREIVTWLKVDPHVVGGVNALEATNADPDSVAVMTATWGAGKWLDANANLQRSIRLTTERWLAAIDGGGQVWVAEGGRSDFTAAVVRRVQATRPDLDTARLINVVQHSATNEDNTSVTDLDFVISNTAYVKIDDGNNTNGTADLRQRSPEFVAAALSGSHAAAWETAFDVKDPTTDLDFSDTVELLYIIGVGPDEVTDPAGFARYFLGD